MAVTSVKLFITTAESNSILDFDSSWSPLGEVAKTTHILNATIYLQSTYSLGTYEGTDFTTADVPQVLKDACALLALEDFNTSIFSRDSVYGDLAEEEVSVGAVKTRKKYNLPSSRWEDRFPNITAMLGSAYPIKKGRDVVAIPLLRR